MKLIVGLGNPGPKYEKTRHNIGAMVADHLVTSAGGRYSVHKRSGAEVASIPLAGGSVLVAKARTYMNTVGRQIGPLAKFYSVTPDDLIVLHDELDIDFGLVRLKRGGGEGGHNGLRSVSQSVGTRDYLRVRLGIGRPPGRQDPADFVLKPFPSAARAEVDLLIEHGADAVELLLTAGLEAAQNTVHAW
ncbi:peptidyl-tRNA hydrolase Pth [Gordonia polyisoprenivorans VH2]|uniref:Peptidyl-tRNA hydrolase n=2 Tax=Gordonia polyisoprenivorans TaxID=84595 RepID=H6N4F1_GORPV|nr:MULTISPECIES: aminoacyl-tRNA hydrolase [Gordonia]AFA72420.1 peptidyl-tRNA hydrolase Pth [Gordonia polyisoprenivorans VH2]MDF3282561.1 aminoacyl-tRNA hydrolase [Gordonia sp. N1V]NKY03863.1 aminoacyl-tRNA hydrolase [Gordonia polyisoprenivorans]OPX09353.1 aminoacyl-tRNA hydrolase [Gordonia sp. i37]OZC29354.1 aminoacyl-tRNA hydrolase [Gordonia polyisoprenivorans]